VRVRVRTLSGRHTRVLHPQPCVPPPIQLNVFSATPQPLRPSLCPGIFFGWRPLLRWRCSPLTSTHCWEVSASPHARVRPGLPACWRGVAGGRASPNPAACCEVVGTVVLSVPRNEDQAFGTAASWLCSHPAGQHSGLTATASCDTALKHGACQRLLSEPPCLPTSLFTHNTFPPAGSPRRASRALPPPQPKRSCGRISSSWRLPPSCHH
jgi:hypothetical protein